MKDRDRELLEMAAKASGILTQTWYGNEAYIDSLLSVWNPIDDDADALRLAVNIGADIQPKGFGVEVWIFERRVSSGVVEYGADPYAATRRAIVLAAAIIGSKL